MCYNAQGVKTVDNDEKLLQILERVESAVILLVEDVTELKSDVRELKSDVRELKSDVAELKLGQAKLMAEVGELQAGQLKLRAEQDRLKAGQDKFACELVELKSFVQKEVYKKLYEVEDVVKQNTYDTQLLRKRGPLFDDAI